MHLVRDIKDASRRKCRSTEPPERGRVSDERGRAEEARGIGFLLRQVPTRAVAENETDLSLLCFWRSEVYHREISRTGSFWRL